MQLTWDLSYCLSVKCAAELFQGQLDKQFSVFTWRYGGHIGVPKQRNRSHVGVPNESSANWTLFLCKRFLLLCICNRIGSRAIAMTYLSHKGQNFLVIVAKLRCQATYDQSASSNHALLITTSTVIKKKCPLSKPISIQNFCLACNKVERHAHWSREWKHSIHVNRALESWHLGSLLSNL